MSWWSGNQEAARSPGPNGSQRLMAVKLASTAARLTRTARRTPVLPDENWMSAGVSDAAGDGTGRRAPAGSSGTVMVAAGHPRNSSAVPSAVSTMTGPASASIWRVFA